MRLPLLLALALAATIALAQYQQLQQIFRQASADRSASLRENSQQLSQNPIATSKSKEGYRYYNDETSAYFVESMPDVPFPLGELYSGSLPIRTKASTFNGNGSLFFFFAPKFGYPVDELVIWLNGGPGWSSLEGFFQENGPITWGKGTYGPVMNAYSWSNLTNVIWVDQPISTGFSIGTPTATNEVDIADQFLGFLQNFEQLFGMSEYRIYLTGESYAGKYLPYIGAGMLDRNDTKLFNLSGATLYDPGIGTLNPSTMFPFIQTHASILNYNSTVYAQLEALHESCGFREFNERYLTLPPPGTQPTNVVNRTCLGILFLALLAEVDVNPCASVYDIREVCPTRYDPLGHSTVYSYLPPGSQAYFDRADVKAAIHAPNITWVLDNGGAHTFAGSGADLSDSPIFEALPRVIEKTRRVVIANGDFDMAVQTNATLLAIQNMTWYGQLGFQTAPSQPINIPYLDLQYNPQWEAGGILGYPFTLAGDAQGVMGIQHYERGLLWAQIYQGGHALPASQPRVAYRHVEWMLGHIDEL